MNLSFDWGPLMGMMLIMFLFGLLVIGVVVALAFWAFRTLVPIHHQPGDDALSILDRRLARGEVGVEEYQKLRKELLRHYQRSDD